MSLPFHRFNSGERQLGTKNGRYIQKTFGTHSCDTVIARAYNSAHTMSSKKTRIMYIERKSGGLEGPARIGRVNYSKTGRSLIYRGKTFAPFQGYKANYQDIETGEEYWISGPKKRGGDRLYGTGRVEIDEDVKAEYWREIRERPENISLTFYRD